jgi:hypothetical protein
MRGEGDCLAYSGALFYQRTELDKKRLFREAYTVHAMLDTLRA